MRNAADQQTIRRTNEKLIIEYLRENETVTRATISQALYLSPPSVSNNVDRLIQKNVLCCIGTEQAGGVKLGRKGLLLDINRDYAHVICVDLSSQIINVGIANLKEEPMCESVSISCKNTLSKEVCKTIYKAIDIAMVNAKLPWEAIGVIVVGAPGVINESTGTMAHATQFEGWDQINLRQILNKRYHVPVLVKNDINTLSLGELKYGHGKKYSDFAVICLDLGVGAGIVLNKRLFTGVNFAAGEVGYMFLEKKDLTSGETLEQKISLSMLKKRIGKALGVAPDNVSAAFINEHYQTDDSVKEIITEMLEYLGMLIINLTAVCNVPLVCLTGFITQLDMDIVSKLRIIVQNKLPYTPQVEMSSLGHNGLLRGGFLIGVDWVLNEIIERG